MSNRNRKAVDNDVKRKNTMRTSKTFRTLPQEYLDVLEEQGWKDVVYFDVDGKDWVGVSYLTASGKEYDLLSGFDCFSESAMKAFIDFDIEENVNHWLKKKSEGPDLYVPDIDTLYRNASEFKEALECLAYALIDVDEKGNRRQWQKGLSGRIVYA